MVFIDDLLKKNEVTGEDIGKLIISNDICMFKKQIGEEGFEDYTPLSQEELDSLTENIDSYEEADDLECYVQLQNFVKYAQAMSYAYNQQAQNGFCRLLMYMTQAQQVEHARRMIELLPMIMTETQFKEMRAPGELARLRGVAIVANNFPCRPKCLDVNDHFIEPEIDCFQEMMSLEHAETMQDKLSYFRNDLMLGGLRYQNAYNKLFELIADRIDIPEFTVFCTDTQELISQLKDLNRQREAMENEIAGEGEEYENKKRILSLIFRPIDLDELTISEEKIEIVRSELFDLSVFRTSMNELIKILLSDRRE
ncbi:hypothetical protein [Ruminococcus flavefaciens]|uniref:Uncharacterized protein n=2 Tax=Ruminococcus flavefaciens TaxID=1265 RepID=W7V1V8_RUMFL|nr:hypothetical protein [Ruminococcus flavefaciens]EWM54975.1 hypothetical protein RF007C_02990 [Ruminococcus flavefaciens 007c]